jgi:hypothetical protein
MFEVRHSQVLDQVGSLNPMVSGSIALGKHGFYSFYLILTDTSQGRNVFIYD